MMLLLLACAGPLLPGEAVLGDEVEAVVIAGPDGGGFGASVAIGEDADGAVRVVVGAPDSGRVEVFDASGESLWWVQGAPGLGTRVGWASGTAWAWAPGTEVRLDIASGTELVATQPESTAAAVCPDGQILTRVGKGEDIACDDVGGMWTTCDGTDCSVEREGSVLDGATTSAGSAVGFWGDHACYGDARIAVEEAPGAVFCEDGAELEGEPGDHLGLAIAGGRVAGVFNRHLRPPRARIPALDGGVVWTIDRAAERSRIALASGHGLFAVGVPGFGVTEARQGRVYLIEVSP
jgi:hypothetical protein